MFGKSDLKTGIILCEHPEKTDFMGCSIKCWNTCFFTTICPATTTLKNGATYKNLLVMSYLYAEDSHEIYNGLGNAATGQQVKWITAFVEEWLKNKLLPPPATTTYTLKLFTAFIPFRHSSLEQTKVAGFRRKPTPQKNINGGFQPS